MSRRYILGPYKVFWELKQTFFFWKGQQKAPFFLLMTKNMPSGHLSITWIGDKKNRYLQKSEKKPGQNFSFQHLFGLKNGQKKGGEIEDTKTV